MEYFFEKSLITKYLSCWLRRSLFVCPHLVAGFISSITTVPKQLYATRTLQYYPIFIDSLGAGALQYCSIFNDLLEDVSIYPPTSIYLNSVLFYKKLVCRMQLDLHNAEAYFVYSILIYPQIQYIWAQSTNGASPQLMIRFVWLFNRRLLRCSNFVLDVQSFCKIQVVLMLFKIYMCWDSEY